MELRFPDSEMLPSYVAALERGWRPSISNPASGKEELARANEDPEGFLASQIVRVGDVSPYELPDGSTVPRIPGFKKWMWDGEFSGGISFRWQPPTPTTSIEELPPHVLGHIGYGVVDWKRRRGYAASALKAILPEAVARGFRYVELTCDADNVGSRKVIESAGGVLYERFTMPESHGGHPGLRFRIELA